VVVVWVPAARVPVVVAMATVLVPAARVPAPVEMVLESAARVPVPVVMVLGPAVGAPVLVTAWVPGSWAVRSYPVHQQSVRPSFRHRHIRRVPRRRLRHHYAAIRTASLQNARFAGKFHRRSVASC
jgi:hypothetical protein